MSDKPVLIQCVNKDRIGLALNFQRRTDRFKHEICIVDGDRQIVLLTSIENHSNQTWPDSPPIQQISKEMILGRPAVLGVGMAGNCHWSGSFLLKVDPMPELICELACLVNQAGPGLSSNYELSPEWSVVEGSEPVQYWRFRSELIPGDVAVTLSAANCSENSSRINIRDSRILIQPTMNPHPSKSAIQWKYRIFLTSDKVV